MFSKTIVVGHLGRDPEIRYTSAGQPVTNFSVATSRTWTDQNGEPQEKTTWFKIVTWGKLAELCGQYLAKGRLVLVEGEIDASAWTAQNGDPKATLELTARNVRFLGKNEHNADEHDEQPRRAPAPARPPAAMEEEEIPF